MTRMPFHPLHSPESPYSSPKFQLSDLQGENEQSHVIPRSLPPDTSMVSEVKKYISLPSLNHEAIPDALRHNSSWSSELPSHMLVEY